MTVKSCDNLKLIRASLTERTEILGRMLGD
jgi:hypothetical protein